MGSNMCDEAIKKLTEEMMANKNDHLILMLEEYLVGVCTTDEVAGKILQGDRSLKEISKKLWERASSNISGRGAYIPDLICFEVAEKYFGITKGDKEKEPASVPRVDVSKRAKIIDILDLL